MASVDSWPDPTPTFASLRSVDEPSSPRPLGCMTNLPVAGELSPAKRQRRRLTLSAMKGALGEIGSDDDHDGDGHRPCFLGDVSHIQVQGLQGSFGLVPVHRQHVGVESVHRHTWEHFTDASSETSIQPLGAMPNLPVPSQVLGAAVLQSPPRRAVRRVAVRRRSSEVTELLAPMTPPRAPSTSTCLGGTALAPMTPPRDELSGAPAAYPRRTSNKRTREERESIGASARAEFMTEIAVKTILAANPLIEGVDEVSTDEEEMQVIHGDRQRMRVQRLMTVK